MLLLIDNYDSFTYNLVQRFGEIDPALEVQVHRNDRITTADIERLDPTHIVISPGPCTPREAGVSVDVIRTFAGRKPLLGVCLGHQCLAFAGGREIRRAERLVHGKTSLIRHDGSALFAGMSNPFQATRYHSLIIAPDQIPDGFVVTATCQEPPEEVMAIQHKHWPVFGVQFHPESFLTTEGHRLLANFLAMR